MSLANKNIAAGQMQLVSARYETLHMSTMVQNPPSSKYILIWFEST